MAASDEIFAVRPTLKRAYATLGGVALAIAAAVYLHFVLAPDWPAWTALLPCLLLVIPLLQWLDHRATRLVLDRDELKQESGYLRKRARTLDLELVTDVRVERSLVQRLWNVGSIVVTTAAADARIEVHDLDAPQRLAQQIRTAVNDIKGKTTK